MPELNDERYYTFRQAQTFCYVIKAWRKNFCFKILSLSKIQRSFYFCLPGWRSSKLLAKELRGAESSDVVSNFVSDQSVHCAGYNPSQAFYEM